MGCVDNDSNKSLIFYLGLDNVMKYNLNSLSIREKLELTYVIKMLYRDNQYYINEVGDIINYVLENSIYSTVIRKLTKLRRKNKLNILLDKNI